MKVVGIILDIYILFILFHDTRLREASVESWYLSPGPGEGGACDQLPVLWLHVGRGVARAPSLELQTNHRRCLHNHTEGSYKGLLLVKSTH